MVGIKVGNQKGINHLESSLILRSIPFEGTAQGHMIFSIACPFDFKHLAFLGFAGESLCHRCFAPSGFRQVFCDAAGKGFCDATKKILSIMYSQEGLPFPTGSVWACVIRIRWPFDHFLSKHTKRTEASIPHFKEIQKQIE